MAGILMNAKFGGYCRTCGGKIDAGTQIYFYPNDTKKAEHKGCNADSAKPKSAKKTSAKTAPKRNILREKVQSEGKAEPPKKMVRFTVVEILKLLPAFAAFDSAVAKAGFDLEDMEQDKLAEMFRLAKNAKFSEDKDEYPF